jgi:PAS domain-containing protein
MFDAQHLLAADGQPASAAAESAARYSTQSLRGRVVWMADAMEQQFGVRADREARQRILALQTPDGQLYPLLEDTRGQSFRKDERLRRMDVELLVRIYEGSPLAQVIRIYSINKDGKFLLDYWCDICAIAMYELGPCDCCQGAIRLRERKAEDSADGTGSRPVDRGR